jgi:hypothetical protein
MSHIGDPSDNGREAALRTYHEMLAKGRDEITALRSAMHVLALRHPDENPGTRADLLAEWLASA